MTMRPGPLSRDRTRTTAQSRRFWRGYEGAAEAQVQAPASSTIPEALPCPCGAHKPATLWRKYSASMLQSLRCPRCKRTGTAAARISDIIRNWNAGIGQ